VERISENAAALRNLPTDQVTDQLCEREKGKKALELATETIDIETRSMAQLIQCNAHSFSMIIISANTLRLDI
jgi:hypothetical protein